MDAVERDRRGETPHQEVQLLKDTGLVTLLGPAEHGGGGQTWETAYQVIREIASADGSIGQLLGYHYLWAWTARLVTTDVQLAAVEELYGDSIVYNGHKSFSTGSKVSDLTVPAIQLVFTNFYLGIAQGALETALAYTRERTRAWPYGGDDKQTASAEWYILDGYGDLQSKLWAAAALVDKAGAAISRVLHAPREHLTPEARGEVAVLIAAAKQRTVDTGLEIATKIFELTGARASAPKYGLDRFWRNLRTHSLHDPLPYKRREVGEYPTPTWYT